MIVQADKSLSNEYNQLESITYTGSQYIDTGYIPSYINGFKIEIDFNIANTGYRYLLLSTYNKGNALSLEINASNYLRLYMNNGNLDTTLNTAITANTKHKAIFEFNPSTKYYTITLDNQSRTASYTNSTTEPTYSMYMFVDRALRYSTFNHNLTIYSCKIWSNNQLVKYFVGAKQVSNDAIGMCDLLTNSFYSNGGSGNFTAGNLALPRKFKIATTRLPNEYQEVEYITFSGAQCIRTGVNQLVHPYSVTTIYNKTNTEATDQCLVGQRQIGKFSNLFNHYYESAYGNTASGSLIENQKATLLMKSGEGVIVNGNNLLATSSTATVSTSYELLIGAFSEDSYANAKWFYKGYIYDVEIVSNGERIRHYIPCYRKSDNIYGLYDTINNTFNTTTTSTPLSGGNIYNTKYRVRNNIATGYTRVEYLKSTGDQWIDTQALIGLKTNIEADIMFDNVYNYNMAYGCWGIFAMSIHSGNTWAVGGGNTESQSLTGSGNAVVGQKYHIVHKPGTVTINGTNYTLGGANNKENSNNQNILLFGASANGYTVNTPYSWSGYGQVKIYNFKIYNDTTLVRNLVPSLRNSDSKPGMYDTLNNVFYTNSGTGNDFTYGKKII